MHQSGYLGGLIGEMGDTPDMIYVFEKTRQADLTPEQVKTLRRVIREELK